MVKNFDHAFFYYIIKLGEDGIEKVFQKTVKTNHKDNIKRNSYSRYDNLSMSSLIARGQIPQKHRQLAGNYMVIKRIFGFSAVHSRITNYERSILKKYGFDLLENSTISQINHQLEQLKIWSNSGDAYAKAYADEIFEIRIKELKFLRASNYATAVGEFYDGYKALERYIEYVAN